MGTSRSGLDWARKLTGLAETMEAAAEGGAMAAAEVIRASVAVASGRYASSSLTRTAATPVPPSMALVRMVSPKAHLLDRDTKAHSILPGALTGHRKRALALTTPDGPRASASVRGTRGKLMWEKGVAAGLSKAEEAISNSLGLAAIAAFSR